MKTAFLALTVIGIVVYLIDTIEPRYPPGILIPEDPYQQLVSGTPRVRSASERLPGVELDDGMGLGL